MSTSAFSWRQDPPLILGYGIAVLSVAAAVVADLAFNRLLGVDPTVSLLLCAIMFVAWVGGTGPALLATALAILAFAYVFLSPVYSFAIQFEEIPRLAFFAAAALFAVSLNAAQRRATTLLRRARDEQQGTVRELQALNEALRIENAERKRAEERTRQVERELQVTIDTVPVGLARYRADGAIDFVNQTYRSFTGLSQDDLPGRPWGAATHLDDLPMIEREWRAHMAEGEPFETEQRIRSADGEYRWHWVRRVPLRDDNGDVIAWYGAGYDIEDRKRTEDALRRSEAELIDAKQELQLMIDTIPVFVATYQPDGTRSFINQSWRNYIGPALALEEAGAKTFPHFHPDDVEWHEEAWRASLASGQPLQIEARIRRADGEYRWHISRRVPLRDEKGNVVKWYSVGIDTEDQKRAETALRASEAKLAEARRELQLMIDSIPAFVATYEPDGRRSYVNQAWQDYTGRTLQEATGGGGGTARYHPDDAERAQKAWHASLATGEPLRIDIRVRTANGDYRWNTHRRVPHRDENGNIIKWYSVGVDIEDQKIAENALRESEARLANAEEELRLTLDTIPTLAWRTRSDGFAEYLNKRWLDYTGISLEQALGWKWQVVIHPDDLPGLLDLWRAMLASGKASEVEARIRRFDGAYRWFLFRPEPLRDETGAVVRWYGTNTDIDDQRRAESEARKSQEALHAAQTALAHASRVATLGEISASIAHEVNQPLAAIVANGQACLRFLRRETPDLDDVRGAIEWIVKDGNRAGEVIRRVRGLLKKADSEKTPLDVNDLINEVAALLQRELAAQQVRLQLELGPAMPSIVADRIQLQQVIINLVMNGAEAMQPIADRPHGLVIRSYRDDAHRVVVAVKDSGVGIPDESADRVFDAFFSTKPGGLGMGLSICRSIVEAHGGRLWSSPNAGPGATFQFALPSHQGSAA